MFRKPCPACINYLGGDAAESNPFHLCWNRCAQELYDNCGLKNKKNGIYETIPMTFSTMIDGICNAMRWLKEQECYVVVLESTGKYWIPVYNLMENDFDLTLANPSRTKTFPGNKTDRRDAKWLAELHRLGLVQPSFIPPKHIRELRDLTRYRHKLVRARSAEKSRIHNILTVCNIMLSSVATDIFGKSGINIINALLQYQELDEETLSAIVLGKLKDKIPDLVLALKGQLTPVQSEKLKIALDNLKNFDEKIIAIEAHIHERAVYLKPAIELLCSCFAIKETAAITILSEIGTDMTQFPSSGHLCSWAGVCPQNNETGGKRRPAKTKPGNAYLKTVLVQCVNALSRSNGNSRFAARFHAIRARRGHNKAVIAVCRSMLTAIYYMLLNNESFQESSATSVAKAERRANFESINDDLLIQELLKRGYKLEAST